MEETNNIQTTSQIHQDLPCLIVDKSGRIIALNPDVKRIISNVSAQSNFFEFFDEEMLLTLQRIFIDARKFESVSKDVIEFEINGEKKSYEIAIIPLRSENNIYFLVSFSDVKESSPDSEIKKFRISTSDIEKLTDDKKVLAVINKIKLTFPFTFIEKAKIQKEINELENHFWIKDTTGKYTIVNESFSVSLGLKATHIENKNQEDFLPKYLIQLYNIMDKLIMETSNTIIFEGVPTATQGGITRDYHVIEIPICDLDGNVVAIIGFSKKNGGASEVPKNIDAAFLKHIPQPVVVIDSNNHIAGISDEMLGILLLNNKIDYTNTELTKIFEKHFCDIVLDFLNDSSKIEDNHFNYVFGDKGNLKVEVTVKKIFDSESTYIGSQLSVQPKNEVQVLMESKARMYDSLVMNIPEAMFVYDLENLKFLEVNDAALKLYGYKRTEFLSMDLTDLYAPEDIQTLITSGDKTGSVNLTGPWRHKRSDGNSILVEIKRSTIEFSGKKAHLNIIKNVTDEAANKKRLQLLQATFDNTNDILVVTDKEGFITFHNNHVNKHLGYSKKDLEDRPFISLVADDDRAKVNKNIFHAGILKTITLEIGVKKPSGNIQKASVAATPVKNYDGEIDSFVIIIKLIEEKVPVKDIDHTQEDALEKIDPPFLSNMFHEILTPINVILGFTQELGESIGTPNHEQSEAIEIIKENQKLLLQIMDNAVEYSTLNEKVIRFQPVDIRFVDLLEELKENTRKAAESKKVELSYGKISSSLELENDRQKFVSLLSLFIKFAVQITKENSIYLSAYSVDENNFAVTVKDSRTEITQYLSKGLSDVFSEEETSGRRNYGFSRFSMRLANKLVELLSAKKELFSKEGKQVEFALIFPNKFVVADKEKMKVEVSKPTEEIKLIIQKQQIISEQVSSEANKQQQVIDLTQLSCLYLEDQLDSQILFKTQMKDLKSIEFAASFEAALPLLKTKRFDFILMDINLQGEYNGLDALRIIQKMPGYKDVPIIASTAYVQPGAKYNFRAAGFSDFISKPLLRERILDVLRNIFS